MACGKPVVAAANAGYAQVLSEQSDYCLCKPGDADDLYSKIKHLVLNPDIREGLARWGLKKYTEYDCKNVIPEILSVYKKAYNSRNDLSGNF